MLDHTTHAFERGARRIRAAVFGLIDETCDATHNNQLTNWSGVVRVAALPPGLAPIAHNVHRKRICRTQSAKPGWRARSIEAAPASDCAHRRAQKSKAE